MYTKHINRKKRMEKTRTDLLNHLAKKHNLNSYLEIGVQVPELNFDRIVCKNKIGVDPDPKAKATFVCTSDEFFEQNKRTYDLVFIDGLHTAEQVQKDFENALKALSPNGFIVLHDCNPKKEEHTLVPRPTKTGTWNGDVYKFASTLGVNDGYCTVDIDNGCGVFRNGIEKYNPFNPPKIFWNYFNENRKQLLNIISWDEFVSIGSLV